MCPICGHETAYNMWDNVSPDWKERVEAFREVIDGDRVDPVVGWRTNQLLTAGFDPASAIALACRRDVDLHRACDLAKKAGPTLAYQIVA